MNWFRKLFKSKEKKKTIRTITYGERDENGFADTYVNGKKTNVKMLLFSKEEIEKLQKIGEKIYEKYD